MPSSSSNLLSDAVAVADADADADTDADADADDERQTLTGVVEITPGGACLQKLHHFTI